MTMDQAIEVTFGEHKILLRRPRAGEFDLALMGRLTLQFYRHGKNRAAVQPGPGAVLEIDRYDQLLEACLLVLLRRTQSCILNCVTAVDGKLCSRESVEALLGPVDEHMAEDKVNALSGAMGSLLSTLQETARLGE